jgi:hypothetical protein
MYIKPDFNNSIQVNSNNSSQNIQLNISKKYFIQNIGSEIVYIFLGDDSVVADNTCISIQPLEYICLEDNCKNTHIAYIAESNTSKINIIPWR